MHSIRKLALMGLAALMLCAVVASSASAVAVRTGSSTGTPLSVGAMVNGTNSGNVTLAGTFFGITTTITCTTSTFTGDVLANPSAGGFAWGNTTNLTFTGCSSPLKNPCTVTVNGLTWDPTTNSGGLRAASATSVNLGTGSAGSIDVSDCLAKTTGSCLASGLTAGPVTDGSYSLSNYVTGTWTNPNGTTSPPQLVLTNATVKINTSCSTSGTGTWNAKYTVKDDLGNLVYLG